MAIADLDKQPDSVSSVLKVFGILQALGEEREIGITELSQRVMMSKSTVYRFLQTMKTLGYSDARTFAPDQRDSAPWCTG